MDVTDRGHDTESGFSTDIGRSITLDYAAELLRMSRRTLYNRIRDGFLQTVRLPNGSRRVLVDSMSDLLRQQREADARRARTVSRY